MKTVEIKIPELGSAIGTTSWVAKKIEHIQKTLKVSKTRQGEPCLTYDHWSDTDKDGKSKTYILMFMSNEQYQEGYWDLHNNVYSLYPEDQGNPMFVYLFSVLSKKAHEYVSSYLVNLAIEFYDQYNES